MKIDHHKKRLGAIKLRYVFFAHKCKCCGEEYAQEKMFLVDLWGINKSIWTAYYCQNCAKTKEDVLEIIDNGPGFGIAFVDDYSTPRRTLPPPRHPGEVNS